MSITYRGHVYSPDSKILPRAPIQAHWDPAVGDRITAWRGVARGHAFDGNLTIACGEIWFLHWIDPFRGGYHWVVDAHTGVVRPMTKTELHLPASHWGKEGIKRWRDAHHQAPMTLEEGLEWCVANDRLCAMEPKGPGWATSNWAFAHLRAVCVGLGHPCWVKRLATLRFPRKVVIAAHRSKVQIAAIYGSGLKGRARRLAHTVRIQRGWGKVRFDATW